MALSERRSQYAVVTPTVGYRFFVFADIFDRSKT
jgi:hypothetical protein